MKLEYVASALNFVWLGGLESHYTPEVAKEISRVTDAINSWDSEHKFGVLFNAYAEPRVGQLMNDFFSPYTIQGDSGGLQMITLGHTPTPELRKKVYEIQAKYSTHAMCFDEIPLRTTGNAQFVNSDNRAYDKSMVEACAKQTALNIIEQVEYFDSVGTKAKPYLIIQGNDFETYQYWTDEIIKDLPKDIIGQLHGIASGGGCLGNDALEDVERYFTLSHLEAPEHLLKNFHLLGVGAPNRIVTLAKLHHLFADDVNISYDSTKHTGGITRAQIQIGHRCVDIGSRQRNAKYISIVEKFDKFQREKLGYSFDENFIFEVLMNTAEERYAKHGQPKDNLEYTFNSNYLRFALLAFSVYNMFDVIHHIRHDKVVKTNHNDAYLNTLKMIKDVNGFNQWKKDFGRYFPSRRVKVVGDENSSLENFFG